MAGKFNFIRHKVFGWAVHQKVFAQGEQYTSRLERDTDPKDSENITFWTKGRIAGVNTATGEATPDRAAGMFSFDLPVYPAGTYLMTAQEPSEWWCVNYMANVKALPTLRPLVVTPGDSVTLPEGTRLFVCEGTLSLDGETFGKATAAYTTRVVQASATEPTYALIFGGPRV